MNLKDKVIIISGSSRGIGRAMALRCAQDGAKIVIAAKTEQAHPILEGTIHSVAQEVIDAGGQALPVALDIRDDQRIEQVVGEVVEKFGGIDCLINNASALSFSTTLLTSMKEYDLMMDINARGTFAMSQACLPHLKKANNPHILTLSPPLNLQAKWFKEHLAYSISKYSMSMCTLGLADEFKNDGIAVNSLWPQTIIATSAIKNNFSEQLIPACRKPEIMADAAYWILTQPSEQTTGNFFVDQQVLEQAGVKDFSPYAVNPNVQLYPDIFLE